MKTLFPGVVDFQADRARLFSRAPAKIFLGHIAAASVLIYLAWDVLALHWLLLWGVWEILVTPTLLYVLGKQAEDPLNTGLNLNEWQNRLHALFAAVGLSWGTFVCLGLDIQNPAHFSMQMAIVAGAAASAARSLGIFKFSYFFYVVPFTGLLAIRIFLMGGDFVLLGILVVIFTVMMCGLANDTSDELSEYLATKLDNLDLAEKYHAAAKKADVANAAKTQFLAQANHDLRQPIHAIGLLTECLRDQKLDADGQDVLDTIDLSIDNLSNLFKSLLNVTSLDSGGLKPDLTVFSLDEVLRQTARQALPEAEERGGFINLVGTSVCVETDKALLSSIVQNLVFNAVKYAPGRKILLGARVRNGTASVHVLDQGIGVPDHLQEGIFQEFVRGNPHGPGRTDGLGLGLPIVSRTARLLDLSVDFNSTEGVGTHVIIDGLEVSSRPVQAQAVTNSSRVYKKPNKTVLIIDDNPQVTKAMKNLLLSWGYDVETSTPMSDYLTRFDMLLMDYHLNIPKNGIDLAKEINQRSAMPTAIISGTITDQIGELAKQEGFWTLHKPVSPMQLRSVLLAMATGYANAS
ncbi:hybrid sensor histidine kinase/response regulator [Hoeflea sp. Naph1]|uniref:ATP-binding response regulator n=1 Tax=Hoeflea sp. Naph1 TaxID=3388653 RepID=UPI00399008CD